ncbi:hypothetical protein IC582_022157 [Cucumis melo]
MIIPRPIKDWSEAAGTSNPTTIDLSIVTPCFIKKVDDWENTIAYAKHVTQIGTSLNTAFASSTSLMLHAWPSSFKLLGTIKVFSRNLQNYRIQ